MKVGGQILWNVIPICETSQIFYLPLKMTEFLADGPDWHLRSGSRSGLPLFSAVDL